ncbi:hypothetical protein GCM10012285_41930 [Streptomyces kronopolitis]|uniref:Uncharacterized protein n=1 Tax=Streptomyces kronopolitis TaxID=1612435 RepID=A0ABQ2JMG9_9ACTN|nr:hypothetical protein GCM10012285_41930 [Streptomyces kronopolitis]
MVRSLIHGVEAIAKYDREALLANAPELPTAAGRVQALVRRLVPGIVLIGLGIVLPLLPILAGHAARADAVRWTLLVLGATSLLSASPEVSGRVSDVLGKALPFR